MLRRLFFCGLAAIALAVCSLPHARGADLYFAEFTSGKVRRFDTDTSKISEVAGGFKEPYAVAFLPAEPGKAPDFLVASAGEGKVIRVSPSGGKSVFASGFGYPVGLAIAGDGTVYISDYGPASDRGGFGKGSIWKVPPGGAKSLHVSGLTGPTDLTLDGSGNLLCSNYSGGSSTAVYKISPTGAVSTHTSYGAALMPYGLALTGDTLYIGVYGSAQVLRQEGEAKAAPWAQNSLVNGIMGMALHNGELWAVSMRRGSVLKIVSRLGGQTGAIVEVLRGLSQPTGVAFRP